MLIAHVSIVVGHMVYQNNNNFLKLILTKSEQLITLLKLNYKKICNFNQGSVRGKFKLQTKNIFLNYKICVVHIY